MTLTKEILYAWCEAHGEEQLALLKELAAIPAPSHHEEKRAEFISCWLRNNGAKNVTIDSAMNVILPFGCDRPEPMLVCMAHTDVVFPDTTPLPVREENGRLYAPGVGDDTANVAALMLCAKFFLLRNILPEEPMLFVFNSCEEGLGNLKGVRQIMSDYAGRIRALVSFDCQSSAIVSRAVGSERWQVSVSTRGGHSYSDFGNPNAIVYLSRLVNKLYQQAVPEKENCRTTYNVGLITGGTSVNTIAQQAEMTYEYRSDDRDSLAVMAKQFRELVAQADCPDARFTVTCLGVRPCGGDVPEAAHKALLARCAAAISSVYDIAPSLFAGSTDANIPLSLGIPAATFGLYRGRGAHTRQEYIEIDSLVPGLKIALTFLTGALSAELHLDFPSCP